MEGDSPHIERRIIPRNSDEGRDNYWRPKIDAAIALATTSPDRKNEVVEELSGVIAKLEQNALRDPLTGLLNRGAGLLLLSEDVKISQKCSSPLGLIFMDLDHFKRINDSFGHEAGDRTLKQAAVILESLVPDGRVFKYGGEELAVILPDTGRSEAVQLGDRIGTEIGGRLSREAGLDPEKTGGITVSMGVVSLGETGDAGEGFKEFLKRADELMYAAKQSGRNRMGIIGNDGQVEVREYSRPGEVL